MEIKDLGDFLDNQNLKITKATITFELEKVNDTIEPPIEPPIVDPPDPPVVEPPVEPPIETENKVTIWSHDFESNTLEDTYSEENIKNDFLWKTQYSRDSYIDTNKYVSIVQFDGSKCMRHYYEKGHWGVGTEWNNPDGGTGVNIYSVLTDLGGWDELYFSYNIYFEDGFDWKLGGKLPGLGVMPDFEGFNGPKENDGSICMMMWQADGKIKWYNYFHEDFDYKYGRGPVIPAAFTTGRWFNITIRLVNSSPWAKDGLCEVFFDGILNHQMRNIRTREEADKYINVLRMNTFQGGGDKSYAPSVSKNMWIDDMELFYFTGDSTPELPIGNITSQPNRDITPYLSNFPKK